MSDWQFLAITLVGVLVIFGFAWTFAFGPNGIISGRRREEARDLEVSLHSVKGLEAVALLIRICHLKAAAHQFNEAELYIKRAMSIVELEFGKSGQEIIPVLEEYAKLFDKQHRSAEAGNMRKRIKQLQGR